MSFEVLYYYFFFGFSGLINKKKKKKIFFSCVGRILRREHELKLEEKVRKKREKYGPKHKTKLRNEREK